MNPPVVLVSSVDPGWRAELETVLREEGLRVALDHVDDQADVVVYLDGDRATSLIADTGTADWIAATVAPLTHAVTSFRDVVSRAGRTARAVVVVTSTDGALGPAGRSVSATVSAGLRGLLVTVLHEAPWLTGVVLVHPAPALVGGGAPDLPTGDQEAIGSDRHGALRWAATEISRLAADPSRLRPGMLITIAHERIA